MDGKLARGMARSIFRSVDLARIARQGGIDALLEPLFHCYQRGGGISPAQVVGQGLALRNALATISAFPVTAEVVRHPTRKRVIIETLHSGIAEGGEQQWMVCAGAVLDIGREELCITETVGHFAVSLHTLKRLYERCSFQEADVSSLLDAVRLWAAPLLYALAQRGAVPGAEFAIPFMGGLLMGTLEINPLKPGKGPTFALLSKAGTEQGLLRPAFQVRGIGVLTLAVNTFVHARDFHSNQHDILKSLDGFGRLFAQEFAAMRAGMLRGLPDERMAARFGGVVAQLKEADLTYINSILEMFLSSPEWRCHAEAHHRPSRFLN